MRSLAAVVALFLLPLTAAGETSVPRVELVGVRTGVTYGSLDLATSVMSECGDCAALLPANEWLWLEFDGIDPPSGRITLQVTYVDEDDLGRHFSVRLYSPFARILIPAARPSETAIVVQISAAGWPRDAWAVVFPVAGALPVDPREFRLAPVNAWEHYSIAADPSDHKAFFIFVSGEPSGETPAAWLIDYRASGEYALSAFGFGIAGSPGVLRVGPAPAVDVTVLPTNLVGQGSVAAISFGGPIEIEEVELTFGSVGAGDGAEEVLGFSLGGTFRVETTASGELWTVGSQASGIRVLGDAATAQIGTVESRVNFTEASFVIGQVAGGSIHSGTATIRHGPKSVSAPSASLGRLYQVSHGDCAGEWSARLSGTGFAVGDAFHAAILAAKGFTPSPEAAAGWQSADGWCGPHPS